MRRGRWTLLAAAGVVVAGVVAALGALYLDPARAAVGPVPGVAMALPADTRVLTGIDVKRFVASPFYQRYGRDRAGRPAAFAQLEARTGLNPERDVDQVLMASAGPTGTGVPGGTVVVTGRFDRSRFHSAMGAQEGAISKPHEGLPLYLFREGGRGHSAVALLDDGAVVLGSAPEVEKTITAHVTRRQGLKSNAALLALLQSVRPGATFWMVGDETVLRQMPSMGSMGGASMMFPGLKSLVVTGDLDPMVSVEALGQAADEAAARQLGDVVRGLVALATLQASQKPELQRLASSVTVSTEGSKVRLSARLPYDLLDALMPPQPRSTLKPPAGAH